MRRYLQHEPDPSSIFFGSATPYSFDATEGSAHQIEQQLTASDLPRLAQEWVQGKAIGWEQLYISKAQRIELPGYPFAKDSFWLPNTSVKPASPDSTVEATDEPEYLIDQLLTGNSNAEDVVNSLYHYMNSNG